MDVLSLAQARERGRDELYKVGKGSDPATEKQSARHVQTVGELASLYIEKWAKPKARSWKADDNLLRNKILPKWRSRAIVDITRADCIALVSESVAENGAPIVADRVTALLSKLFNFAVDRALLDTSPAIRLPRPGAEQSRDRVLTESELRALWLQFEALDPTMCAFSGCAPSTAQQRGGEVAEMRWQDLDLDAACWTIPATSAKNKMAHRVPLMPPRRSRSSSATTRPRAPAGRGAPCLRAHRRRERKRQQAEAAATFTVPNFVPHDLRRTAASFMAASGVPRLTIKKILNHVERDVTSVYDRHGYGPERAALTWWDAKLAVLADKSGVCCRSRAFGVAGTRCLARNRFVCPRSRRAQATPPSARCGRASARCWRARTGVLL